MPSKRRPSRPTAPEQARLEFDPDVADAQAILGELSALASAGDSLFLASDETTSLERLTRLASGRKGGLAFGAHQSFPLADYIDLPGGAETEVDVEGLSAHDGYLWLVGSHSVKRGNAKLDGGDVAKQIAKLARVKRDPNRYLLARIPLVPDENGGVRLAREAPGTDGQPARTAARIMGGDAGSVLLDALRDDPHVGPYVHIPGKDNGLDVEGLASLGERLLVGLRGPVLRGWAIVVEIEPEDAGPGLLGLRPLEKDGRTIRKHFLDLRGMGVRELTVAPGGEDILVLAGPTMVLAGDAAIYRWRPGRGEGDTLVGRDDLPKVLDLPHGRDDEEGVDHPEGITCLDDGDGPPRLLVAYDAPRADRVKKTAVLADVFAIEER